VSEADILLVMLVINSAVGCHYLLPGPRLPAQHQSITELVQYQFKLPGKHSANDLPGVTLTV